MSENVGHKMYQDPDYENIISPQKNSNSSKEKKFEKICGIINKEFSNEIEKKEKDIDIIDQRLLLAKKTLHKLRYAIVKSYYNSKQYQLTEEDVRQEIVSQKDPVARTKVHALLKDDQKRLHPALKKILGTKADMNLDDLFKIRPPRKRGKVELQAGPSSENLTIPVDDNFESLRTINKEEIKQELDEPKQIKIPRYIEPKDLEKNVLKIDPAIRNKQKNKFRIIIGNTSKYTPPHSDMDKSTHRWLLYIRGPRDKPDITHFVNSITIKLDSSYAPHNVIQLKSSPFHLSRRGWGEFPVDVQVHFKNGHLNKPVNIIHNLKLDRNYTGLQTLGGETVVDVWLYCDESMIETEQKQFEDTQSQTITTNSISLYIKKEPEDSPTSEVTYENDNFVKIKSEMPEIEPETISLNSIVKTETDENIENIVLGDARYSSPVKSQVLDIRRNHIIQQHNISLEHSSQSNQSFMSENRPFVPNQKYKALVKTHPNSLLKINELYVENMQSNLENIESIIEDHCYVKEIYLVQTNSTIQGCKRRQPDTDQNNVMDVVTSIINFFNMNINKFDNIRSAVNIMLKRMPLVHLMAETEEFQRIFPYAVTSEEIFYKLHFIKRRNLEWTRAKIIKNFLKSHWSPQCTKSKIWSVKQIIIFSHYHGYFPIKKQLTADDTIFEETSNNCKHLSFKRQKYNHGFINADQINTLSDINVFKTEMNVKVETNSENSNTNNCFDQSILDSKMYKCDEYQQVESCDDEIDICGDKTEIKIKNEHSPNKIANKYTPLPITDINDKLICAFIEKHCAKLGIDLRNEDVGSGYSDCVAHKTILCAMKCLIEDILRRSLAVKMHSLDSEEISSENIAKAKSSIWQRTECGLPLTIGLKDVYEAIDTRQEFDLLTNCGLGTLEMEYSEKL